MKFKYTKTQGQGLFLAFFCISMMQCTSIPEDQKVNQQLIKEHNLTVREIPNLPESSVASRFDAMHVNDLEKVEDITLYPGVSGDIFWGRGTMAATLQLEANAEIPEETLAGDHFVFVQEGSVMQLVNGEMVELMGKKREEPDGTHSATPVTHFVYLQKGSKNALKAGPEGAKILTISSPLRLDYLTKAGVESLPETMADVPEPMSPNVSPNKPYNLYDIQLTELAKGAYSRLVSGTNTQMSFISMAPGSEFPHHIHPEEQMMFALRGECEEILLDGTQTMNPQSVVVIPGNMVHGAKMGEVGCDALDIFWPARKDYLEKEEAALKAYHDIIPKDAKVKLLVDGTVSKPSLTFSEGPKWMNGKVYFSNMYFDQSWNGDPKKSTTVELSPDGTYKNISTGLQTNGLYPYKNGNLVVCDMMGHRVVEMTPQGKVVNVLADSYEGKSLDGPNDVITDAKGGIYFTDPQFTLEAEKFQPGRAVYYLSPEGKLTRLLEPNAFAMPNGIILSPDGKTLYINNTYDNESWYPVDSDKDNFIWAYDVNEDGTISNGRKFAELFLTANVLDRKGKSTSADGMAIDTDGNLYVATYYGVQIFNKEGKYVGMINLPHFPVSLCFGGDDMKTLYMVSYSWVYTIDTNKKGYINYL
ncbi:MAG: SMP-30/gluconolactonase/LRE family protein [Saprospiraceae bacterium]|nr:SMP-30/gluconolactonase/LRE family protein [Saprospiraceae bacterium]